jgi:D-alanyl-D-alanine dipeptidase
MRMAGDINYQRLAELSNAQQEYKTAAKNKDVSAIQALSAGHEALRIKELQRDIVAAYGPTLAYMKGMEEYA